MIYLECKADRALVQSLTGWPRREVRHENKGKGEVCNQLRKNGKCIGLVDEDPGSTQPKYLGALQTVKDLPDEGLRLLHDVARDNAVVVLCPRLEEWVLAAAKQAQVSLKDYKLPDDPATLYDSLNLDPSRVEPLVAALKDGRGRMRTLRRMLEGRYDDGVR